MAGKHARLLGHRLRPNPATIRPATNPVSFWIVLEPFSYLEPIMIIIIIIITIITIIIVIVIVIMIMIITIIIIVIVLIGVEIIIIIIIIIIKPLFTRVNTG